MVFKNDLSSDCRLNKKKKFATVIHVKQNYYKIYLIF